jgi:hypothetical protein
VGASASAATVPEQDLTATGSAASPDYQTYTASSTGTSPAHVSFTVTQTSALGFSIKSTFSDDTAGTSLASNDAASTNTGTYEGEIVWGFGDGDVETGNFDYVTPGSYLVTDTVTDGNGATATAQVEVNTLGSAYAAVAPTRILDTPQRHRCGEGQSRREVARQAEGRRRRTGPVERGHGRRVEPHRRRDDRRGFHHRVSERRRHIRARCLQSQLDGGQNGRQPRHRAGR